MVRCDIGSAYCDDWTVNCKEKNRIPMNCKCDKSTVISNVDIAQCNDNKILNVTKIEIDAMLVLLNKTMKSSNVRKELSYMILELLNIKLEPSNMRKK